MSIFCNFFVVNSYQRNKNIPFPDGTFSMQWMNSLNLPRSQDGITNAMMALEKVLSILRKERGRQFDPDVTDAFLLILDR